MQETPTNATVDSRWASRKKWLVRFVNVVIVALVTWGVAATVRRAIADLETHTWSLRPWWLVLSGAVYLVSVLPSGLFWHRILVALGQRADLGKTLRAYYIGSLGKYVPGKALVVVIRTWLVQDQQVDARMAVVSIFLETLTMMAVGAFLGASILLAVPGSHDWLALAALGVMIVVGLPTVPPVFRRLALWLLPKDDSRADAADLNRISYKLMAGGWLSVTAGWVLMALSLWATLRSLDAGSPSPVQALPLYTASVALAVVGGFLSGIPGGVYVREGILGLLLAQHLSEGIALVAAVLLRLVWLLSEILVSALLYVGLKKNDE